jgi:hydrogenase nickel incorporation protein HypA/HybF
MHVRSPAVEAILNNALRRANEQRITGIHLVVGELVNGTDESIQESWNAIAKGTPAEGATLHIRRAPAELQCMACFQKYHLDSTKFSCPRCGGVGAKVISGEEFSVETVDVG